MALSPARRSLLLLSLLPILAGCASTAPSTTSDLDASSREALPASDRICREETTAISWADAGIPDDEQILDVAVSGDAAWILFSPGRLVRAERTSGSARIATKLSPGEERWTAMDVDPGDGALWLAASPYILKRVLPDWTVETVVPERVFGEGSFLRILVAGDEIWAVPAFADHLLWRLDRSGRLLAAEFPVVRSDEDRPLSLDPEASLRRGIRLERLPDGTPVVWEQDEERVWRLEGGSLVETEPGFFADVSSGVERLRGIDVGSGEEVWYFEGRLGDLFYLDGRPHFLGSTAWARGQTRTVVLVGGDGAFAPEVEDCGGSGWMQLLGVSSDSRGLAAVTHAGLVLTPSAGSRE